MLYPSLKFFQSFETDSVTDGLRLMDVMRGIDFGVFVQHG